VPAVAGREEEGTIMQRMKTRGMKAARFIVFILFIFVTSGLAFGQAPAMRFEVPYKFAVGSKALPAGTYTFSVDQMGFLSLKSATGGPFRALVITRLSGPAELFRDGSLIFDKTNGDRILSEVWIPGTDGLLLHKIPKDHSRDVLLGSELSQTRASSGKTAYNLTCAKCHGADGKGNKEADKFFDIMIPRLSSAEVQGKSDAELRELIAKGSDKMPPVEVDEAGFRHRLPQQDVDAVIAYVRTLKR
jgi:mono/diheme cytochrome c family protein